MNNEQTMTLGARICALRKAQGMTQEQLAEKLSVTFQAVSKWENDIACPDVLLLPQIADVFGITTDELFGRPAPAAAAPQPTYMDGLPWPDDNGLYAVVCKGHTLLSHQQVMRYSGTLQRVVVEYTGEALNVTSDFGVEIRGNVAGNVEAKDGVTCGDVGGNVHAGDGVQCGEVKGSARAGDSLYCGSVGGDVSAGDGVTCGDVSGNVRAGDGVRCGNIGGSVTAGDSVHCTGIGKV